jgi:NitT/TauT family transport system ATP-binding protein
MTAPTTTSTVIRAGTTWAELPPAAPPPPSITTSKAARGAIRIEEVVKIYEGRRGPVTAVDGCSLDIAAGEIFMVVGPSGCGKTTLLNAIAGFHGITSGRITLDGQVLCDRSRPQAKRGSDRVVVFQNGALFPWRTNLENVIFGPVMRHELSKRDAEEKAMTMLADAGLSGMEHSYPAEVSSGVRRRVEIVRALMNDPKVLLLDEPYRALDALTKSVMHESLLRMYDKNPITIFFITHDLEEALFLGHKVAVMTTRPCRPKRILEVDISHPRDYGVLTSRRFRELVRETSAAVHEEAVKAFQSGEREG